MNILSFSPIILILLAIITFLLTKKIFQALGVILIILLLSSFVTGFLIYNDVQDFKEQFATEEKLFLLTQEEIGKENEYFAGFTMESNELGILLDDDKIKDYKLKTNKEILNNNYKLLLFSKDSFDNLKRFYINDIEFKKIEFLEVIESENSLKDAARLMDLSKDEFKTMFDVKDDSETRSLFFGIMVSEAIEQDSQFLIRNIKEKTIKVYPETILFKLIKFIPESVFNNILKGMDITKKVKKYNVIL